MSRDGSDETLESLVARIARSDGADPASISWDAWRREDGSWAVVAAFPLAGADRMATWIFDPRTRSVYADDAEAQRMGAPEKVVPLRAARSSARQTVVVEREVIDVIEIDDVEIEATLTDEIEMDIEPAPVTDLIPPSEPAATKGKKGRRASVPSWDEILFGAGQGDS